jgi:putative two-component system response regulator
LSRPFTDTIVVPDEIVEALARSLSLAIALRDEKTGDHCVMVGEMAGRIARVMGYSVEGARLIVLGGRLHDLGKIAVPDRILRNTDRLSERETRIIRDHAGHGERILDEMAPLSDAVAAVALMVGSHHERWNGGGYPRGTFGPDIIGGARIIAVADAYSAITMARTYQESLGHDHAVQQIKNGAGIDFDPAVVEAFLSLPESGRLAA